MATFSELRVVAVDPLCDDAVAITLDTPEEFAFRPGQSLTIQRGDARRSYSICAPAGSKLRIGVREVPGGEVSQWLVHELKAGDTIQALPPSGRFVPDLDAPGHHGLIAAGSGITPMLSIAASVLRNPDTRVTLLYGNRRTDTVMFADELADLKDRYPDRITLTHVLSREARDVELFSGRLDAAKLRELLPLVCEPQTVDHWWLCGPFGLVTDAQQTLTELGADPARIHRELFYVEDVAPPPAVHADAVPDGPASQVTVVLDGRATTVALPR
ncbi:MAG TPA: FAD-binding oxidoreductase, partial [Jatrophihabitantaceae bacterium]